MSTETGFGCSSEMPRYRVVWADDPKEHRASYPTNVQQQLDQRIEELLVDPRARASFFPGLARDHWITSFGPKLEGSICGYPACAGVAGSTRSTSVGPNLGIACR